VKEDSDHRSGRVRLRPITQETTMPSVSERPEAPTLSKPSCRQFCLFGTQPLHLADHIAVAGLRRENCRSIPCEPGTSRRCWRAFGAQAEGVGADRKILSDRRHSGSGSRRLLASSGAAKRGRRKPCRRSVEPVALIRGVSDCRCTTAICAHRTAGVDVSGHSRPHPGTGQLGGKRADDGRLGKDRSPR